MKVLPMKNAIHLTLAAVLIAGVALPAAAQTGAPASGAVGTTGSRPAAKPVDTSPDYRMVPGDKLRVEVYKDAALSQNVQIRPDGKIPRLG